MTHPSKPDLVFAIDWNKPFLGREALLSNVKRGPSASWSHSFWMMPSDAWGQRVDLSRRQTGWITHSGSYGHTLEAAIGWLCQQRERGDADSSSVQYEIKSPDSALCEAFLRPPYDPARKRILA